MIMGREEGSCFEGSKCSEGVIKSDSTGMSGMTGA